MKGNQQVIEKLNELLAGELSAMDQYFVHSRMYQDWGLEKLYERIDHEFDDEKQHAAALIERILFLEGTPDMVTRIHPCCRTIWIWNTRWLTTCVRSWRCVSLSKTL